MICFDDGPSEYTERILDLVEGRTDVVFAFVGEEIRDHPEDVWIAGKRHQIANHTWSHRRLPMLDNAAVIQQFLWAQKEIFDVADVLPMMWRPPYVDYDQRVSELAARVGLTHRLPVASVGDWDAAAAWADILKAVGDHLASGGFVGLHELETTVDFLPEILDAVDATIAEAVR